MSLKPDLVSYVYFLWGGCALGCCCDRDGGEISSAGFLPFVNIWSTGLRNCTYFKMYMQRERIHRNILACKKHRTYFSDEQRNIRNPNSDSRERETMQSRSWSHLLLNVMSGDSQHLTVNPLPNCRFIPTLRELGGGAWSCNCRLQRKGHQNLSHSATVGLILNLLKARIKSLPQIRAPLAGFPWLMQERRPEICPCNFVYPCVHLCEIPVLNEITDFRTNPRLRLCDNLIHKLTQKDFSKLIQLRVN